MSRNEEYGDLLQQLDAERLPQHIAIIMDGNGRWATRRNLPRTMGHKAGAESLRRATEICREIGVKVLTVYAFSTENWQRPQDEVDFLMKLFAEYLRREIKTMNDNQVRLHILGETAPLPPAVQRELAAALSATAHNDRMILNIAVNYGGRREIAFAMRQMAEAVARGDLSPQDIDEAAVDGFLFTAGQPQPDLLIRPAGELRLSNFLLWQAAYSEFYFSDILWPDFGKRDLLTAVLAYQKRQRRFGKI
ncbi:MAG: isoprenyl transferase [Firmicutes bacterium]|nr:isoprenyl transferase [Bacillota bacterium]